MSERLDMMVARKGSNDKTFWTKIGAAFKTDKGWSLTFDALPIPDDRGQVRASLFPPREREERPQQDDSPPW